MKPSLRDPLDGWWSHEFRAWMRAVDRGASRDELEELDEHALEMADELRARAREAAEEERDRRWFVDERVTESNVES